MSSNQIEKIRHSLSHLMSMAVVELYPKAGLGVGPFINNGFYQDYDLPEKISEEILLKLEARVRELIKKNIKFIPHEMDFASALEFYKNDPYKTELILELRKAGEKNVSFYKSDWYDNLCKGPHIASTEEINPNAFKLTKLAGAYWRGDEKNKMLTRIYGVAFETKEELDNYLKMLEEAEKRDHRKLGKELDLFIFSELVGQGTPLYTFKGALIRRLIAEYSDELQTKIGYRQVHTPNITRAELFKVSGHYDKFKNDMLMVKSHYSEEEYFLKPMNCPHHTQIYAANMRSYRDLPIRIADFANLYRDEKPGELAGLTRLRCFSQDDAHCFCREDQIKQEFEAILGIIREALNTYNMKYKVRLSLRDPQKKDGYIGNDEVWNQAEKMLEELLIANKADYERVEGEAAFYGPKMDFIATDTLNREWQISTIQIDFNMPVRFGLTYIAEDGKEKNPVMIHRAIIGSPERFMGILIEHYGGIFPVWLSPVQVEIVPVGEKHLEYANTLASRLKFNTLRVEVDNANETVGKKIRNSVGQKIPYIIVIGDKEIASGKLNVRLRGQESTVEFSEEEFVERVEREMKERKDEK